jgi:hypothetical protein
MIFRLLQEIHAELEAEAGIRPDLGRQVPLSSVHAGRTLLAARQDSLLQVLLWYVPYT